MADERNESLQSSPKQNKKSLKRTSDTQREVQDTNTISECLQEFSKYFGVGGLYSNKKRKIETHKKMLPVLNEGCLNLNTIKNLSKEEKKRYAKEMSPITLKNLVNLKKMKAFFNKVSNPKDRKQVIKDVTMDYLLKDLKTNPSLQIPERYCEVGLWKQIMQINQQVWKTMESLEQQQQQDEGSNSSKKDSMQGVESEMTPTVIVDSVAKAKKTFRDFYMDTMTSNFSDDLDKLRKDSSLEHKKISILIDCLETGKDIWSDVEKELLQSLQI